MIAQTRSSNLKSHSVLKSSPRSLSVATRSDRHPSATAMPRVRKTLHLMRHGQTEMNEFLSANESSRFDDPMLFDTVLSTRGQWQAAQAHAKVQNLSPQPQLIVSSPLTSQAIYSLRDIIISDDEPRLRVEESLFCFRALQTAEAAFKHCTCRRSVCHWAAERIYHASDVGAEVSQLKPLWPSWDFSDVPSVWWHTTDPQNLKLVTKLSEGEFNTRIQNLREWLLAQPEDCIALVSHWGVLRSICHGKEFSNAEVHTITLESE